MYSRPQYKVKSGWWSSVLCTNTHHFGSEPMQIPQSVLYLLSASIVGPKPVVNRFTMATLLTIKVFLSQGGGSLEHIFKLTLMPHGFTLQETLQVTCPPHTHTHFTTTLCGWDLPRDITSLQKGHHRRADVCFVKTVLLLDPSLTVIKPTHNYCPNYSQPSPQKRTLGWGGGSLPAEGKREWEDPCQGLLPVTYVWRTSHLNMNSHHIYNNNVDRS